MHHLFHALSLLKQPRRLYRSHLSHYRIFRALKGVLLWIYFRSPSFFVKLRLAFLTEKRTLQMVPLRQFLATKGITPQVIKESLTTSITGPRFAGRPPLDLYVEDTVLLAEPPIEVVTVPNVTVMGGTDLFLTENLAVYPDVHRPDRDVIPAEYLGITSVNAKSAQVTLPLTRKRQRVERAISLLGNCTGNYAHWITETLPKLVIVDDIEEFRDDPLLVDDWIHPNILASLELLNKHHRKIIWVARWEVICVNLLVHVSPPAYTPPEFRSYYERKVVPKPDPDFFPFSEFALQKLRISAWQTAGGCEGSPSPSTKRVHLDRPSKSVGNGRLIANNEEVHSVIARHGFVTVNPGTMSVVDQIALFKEAECVIAPIGAALVNLVFAPPGCQVIVMSPYYENANYYYFSNLMAVLGHDMRYVIGPQVCDKRVGSHIAHQDYSINLADLEEALEKLHQ